MRDQMHDFAAISAINPAVLADDPAAITVDRAGFDSVTFVLTLGVGGISFSNTNRIDFVMEHSDDGTAWDAVNATNVLGAAPDASGIVLSQRSAHPNPTVHRFGYVDGIVGQRRFVRLRPDFSGTHGTGTPIAAIAVLGGARNLPIAA